LPTKAGNLTFRAQAFQIDAAHNLIHLSQATITAPDGTVIAKVRSANVSNAIPESLVGAHKPIYATLVDVSGTIKRLPNGELDFQRFLPARTETTSNIAYSVRLVAGDTTPAHVHLIDLRGSKKWESDAYVSTFNLQGVGQRFTASANVAIEGIGKAVAEFDKDPDTGLSLDGRADHLDLSPLIAHLISLPETAKATFLRSVTARNLTVSGPVRVFVPNDGQTSFDAAVTADATGLEYKDQFVAESAHFEGLLTYAGLKGTLKAVGQGVTASYIGGLSWGKEAVLGGSLQAQLTGSQGLPPALARFIPKGASFQNGTLTGWVSWSGGGGVAISGSAKADSFLYQNEHVANPSIDFNAATGRVDLDLVSANWEGAPVHGALVYTAKDKGLSGLLVANQVSLGSLAARAKLKNIEGTGNVQALLAGTTLNPLITLRATGKAATWSRGKYYDLGDVVAAAQYQNDRLRLNRLSVDGPDGIATAQGIWDRKHNALKIDVVGSGVPLAVLGSDITGRAAFLGTVTGTPSNPSAKGRVEIYNAAYKEQQVPLVLADVTASKHQIVANQVEAFKDATRATGNLTYNVDSTAVSGSAQAGGVSLGELFGPNVAGTVSLPNANIGGTLKSIKVAGEIKGDNIVADRVKVDTVDGHFTLNGRELQMVGLAAAFDEGSLTASGNYNLDTKRGNVNGSINGVGLSTLNSFLPSDTAATGDLTGAFSADLQDGLLLAAQASGNANNIAVNDILLGAGPFSVKDSAGQWSGGVTIGDLERYLAVEGVTYNQASKTIHAQITAYNLTLHNLYAAALPYIATQSSSAAAKAAAMMIVPDSLNTQLQTMSGNLNANLTLDGNVKDPNLNIPTLEATDLDVSGEQSGTINATASRTDGVWDLKSFTWTGGPGNVNMVGSVAENGQTQLSGSMANLNPSWFSIFSDGISKFTGVSNVTFKVTGPTKNPTIDSTLDYLEGTSTSSDRRQLQVAANITNGQIKASGTYFYDGFSGPLSALIPFEYPFTVPKDKPVVADLSFPSRPLSDLTSLIPWLDTKRSNGTVEGAVHVQGTANQLAITGQANLAASVLAGKGSDTTLTDVVGNVNFDGKSLNLNASGKGSNGGAISITGGKFALGNVSDAISQSLDALLLNPVEGSVNIDHFKVVQKGADPINAVLDGGINISGKMQAPDVRGTLSLLQGNITVPGAPSQTQANFTPKVNPHFNVALSIPGSVKVKAGVGNFQLTGSGNLTGTLGLPNLDASLVVEKGTIQLPNARINIDPGGTVHTTLASNPYGTPSARADVDVTGTTALTANPYGNIIQRYDIDLQVHGDLLAASGLQITAQSNPPDLTQDKILMMLGQGGLFEQQLANQEPYRPDQQLQQALYTALPLFVSSATNQLANGLGLDYLSFEYNALEGITVTGAKSLSKNLVLSARREVSQPLPGEPVVWDLRLSYRLPLKGKLRNLNLIAESSQFYPYRLSLEYGFRF
jgi:autotransporter translocation and assembly factor TamB